MANQEISIKISLDKSDFEKGMKSINKTFKDTDKFVNMFNRAMEKVNEVPEKIITGVKELGRGIKEAGVYSKMMNRELKKTVSLFKTIKTQQVGVNKALNRSSSLTNKLANSVKKSATKVSQLSGALNKTMSNLSRISSKAGTTFNKLSALMKRYGDTAASSHRKNSKWGEVASITNSKILRSIARVRRAYYLLGFAFNPLKKLVGSVSLGFSILSYAIVRSTNNMDKVIKKSSMLNVAVSDLQALAFAADMAGVNFETLTMSMQRMVRRVSQAAGVAKNKLEEGVKFSLFSDTTNQQIQLAERKIAELTRQWESATGDRRLELEIEIGSAEKQLLELEKAVKETGEAAVAIRELGLDANKLNKLSADKQFLKIAEALSKIKNKNDQIRIAQKIWDSEGVRNVLLLSDALKENIKLFNDLGAGLTQKQATAVEKFKDSLTRLSTFISSIFGKAVAKLSPIFEKGIQKLVDFMKEMGGIEKVASNVAYYIGKFIGKTVEGFGTAIAATAEMTNRFKIAGLQIKSFFTAFIPAAISTLLEKILKFSKRVGEILSKIFSKIPLFGKEISDEINKGVKDIDKEISFQKKITIEAEAKGGLIQKQIDKLAPDKMLLSLSDVFKNAGKDITNSVDRLTEAAKKSTEKVSTPSMENKTLIREGNSYYYKEEGSNRFSEEQFARILRQEGIKVDLVVKSDPGVSVEATSSSNTLTVTNQTSRQVSK